MSWLKTLFSSSEIVETATKGIYNGIDAAVYTQEEKAEDRAKRLDLYLKFVEATATYSISRRIIATAITAVWLLLVIATAGLIVAGHPAAETLFDFMFKVVFPPFETVLVFYFLKRIINK